MAAAPGQISANAKQVGSGPVALLLFAMLVTTKAEIASNRVNANAKLIGTGQTALSLLAACRAKTREFAFHQMSANVQLVLQEPNVSQQQPRVGRLSARTRRI